MNATQDRKIAALEQQMAKINGRGMHGAPVATTSSSLLLVTIALLCFALGLSSGLLVRRGSPRKEGRQS